MPEATLLVFGRNGETGAPMPADGDDCEQVLSEFAKAGIDLDTLTAQLQAEGTMTFGDSWNNR